MTLKYYQASTANRDRWMVSYLDVVTILLIFFLFIASRSKDRLQPTPAPPPVAKLKAVSPPPIPEARQALLRLQQRLQTPGLDLRMDAQGLVISLPQAVLFAPGDDRIGSDALPAIARIADALRDLPNEVRLVGHADAVPIHNQRFRGNWDLSTARSLRMLELLSQQYGIAEARLSIAGYGPYHPSSPNDTTGGRARNRRVEIVILEETRAVSE